MIYTIPEVWELELDTLVLDLNGTLTVNWKISDWVKNSLIAIKEMGYEVYLLTWDQRGTAQDFCNELWIKLLRATTGNEKRKMVEWLSSNNIVSIWNARIDIGMFEVSRLAIATLQAEWIHAAIIPYVDIIIPTILDALKMLLDPNTMAATMRK